MKKRMLIILLCAGLMGMLFSSPSAGKTGKPVQLEFEHISVEHGLAQVGVTCILQDRKGFMWFGTLGGLSKYDGSKFTNYTHSLENSNSLSQDMVRTLCQDQAGRLWIGTYHAGLVRLDPETETFTRYKHDAGNPNSLCHDFVLAVCCGRSGVLWIGTYRGGLNKFDPVSKTFTHYKYDPTNPNSLSNDSVRCLCEDRAGILWLGTWGGGLNRFDPERETFTCYKRDPDNPDSLRSNFVDAVYEDREGVLWIGCRYGKLSRFQRETGTFVHYDLLNKIPRGSSADSIIYSIYQDRTGIMWIGTGAGLFLFNMKTREFTRYYADPGSPSSLSHDTVSSICEERGGILWFGTWNGLDKLDRKRRKFTHYKKGAPPYGLNHSIVWSFLEDRTGALWVGTDRGGINKLDRKTGTFSYYTFPRQPGTLIFSRINDIYQTRDGMIWFGTMRGLFKFDPGKDQFIRVYQPEPGNPNSLSSASVTWFCEAPEGILWIGTWNNGLNRFDMVKEQFIRCGPDAGNPNSPGSNRIYCIQVSRSGALWLGTHGGLNRFDPQTGTFTRYYADPQKPGMLSQPVIYCVLEDRSGNLWAGSGGGGLNRLNRQSQTFIAYTRDHGLPSNTIFGLLEDSRGNLWVSSPGGLSQFNPKTGAVKNYTLRDGLQSYDFNTGAHYKSKGGEMFFGGINGFNCFYPDKINMEENSYIPPVLFTGFKVFFETGKLQGAWRLKKHISYADEIVLPYKKEFFSLEFAVLDYANPAKNQYMYMVEGIHEDWIHLGNKNEITFASLAPGEYTVKVKGANHNGVWNDEAASLKIIIVPPFWKTWWFQGLCVLLAALLAYLWHRLRMNNLSLRLKTETEMERIFKRHNISPREQEIIRLIMKGKSNKEIEDTLYISLTTVKTHAYNIYKKFGVKNRLELIHSIQKSVTPRRGGA